MKICTKCKVEKEVLFFSKNKNKKDGFESQCKSCVKEYQLLNKDKIKSWNKQYNIDNKDKKQLYQEQYYIQNVEKIKEYYVKNKECRTKYGKEYGLKNVDKNKKYRKEYNLINSEKKKLYQKKYNKNKPESSKSKDKQWKRNRYNSDSLFKLTTNIRSNIYQSLIVKGYYKNKKTQVILGCTFEEFKNHIEKQFESWMTWENHGLYNGELNYGWDIDHIIPISSAKSEEEIIKFNHHTNFQPLCSKVNRDIKRDRLDYKEIKC